MSALPTLADSAEQAYIDQTIAQNSGRPGALLGILEAVQEHHPHKYLSSEALRYVAVKLDIPLSRIYSVATFYALFNLQPQGDNTVCICRGTACHTRNSRNLLESLRLELGLGLDDDEESGDADKLALTTKDGKLHGADRGLLRAVRAGAGGGDQPPHLRARQRAHSTARGAGAGTGE